MAYTEKRPSGKWRAGFRLNGRKINRAGFDYEYEAIAWAEAEEKRLRSSTLTLVTNDEIEETGPTAFVHGRDWLERNPHWTRSTYEYHARYVRVLATDVVGRVPMRSLRRPEIQQWMTRQRRDGVGTVTINRRLKTLRSILRDALADGLIDRDPTFGVKFLTQDVLVERTASPDEEDRLLDACDGDLRVMVLIAIDTGLRIGEIFGIEAEAIAGGVLTVRAVVERPAKLRRYPKGKKSRRVPLSPRTVEAIDALGVEAGLLFRSEKGTPVDYHNWRHRAWVPARTEAKLEDLRFHDLRHTFGTRLGNSGAPESAIQKALGHSDRKTTARYVHAAEDAALFDMIRKAQA